MIDRANLFGWALSVMMLMMLGCQRQPAAPAAALEDSTATSVDPSTENPDSQLDSDRQSGSRLAARRSAAVKAKEALFLKLSSRLKEVMQSEGPAAAINVCSREATQIANVVGEEHGVLIGRTSFKLRNPKNAPADWAKPLVEQRVETVQEVELDDGSLGVLFPIHLQVQCLMCHGGPEDLLDAVKPELARLYPNDSATGFQQGDLRGWFWVKVPQ